MARRKSQLVGVGADVPRRANIPSFQYSTIRSFHPYPSRLGVAYPTVRNKANFRRAKWSLNGSQEKVYARKQPLGRRENNADLAARDGLTTALAARTGTARGLTMTPVSGGT